MDGFVLGLFLLATFLGALTTGLAGFAMGLVVSGIWLHIITPMQTAILITAYAMITQSYGVWKLRHALRWRTIAPFIVGGAVGVPVGTLLLAFVDPAHLRTAIGVFLVLYSVYSLVRPAIRVERGGLPADLGVGVVNGFIGGLTGLGGVLIAIWSQLRGGPKDVQRMLLQPVLLVTQMMSLISLSVAGGATAETGKLFLLGLPAIIAGMWLGFRLYGKLDDAAFRKVILVLLLVSGMSLIVPPSVFAAGIVR